MTVLDMKASFQTISKTIDDLYSQGSSYYIPLYQREYSWGSDNIEQLVDDISRGVRQLKDNPGETLRAIKFLGTLILVQEKFPYKNIDPKDSDSLPTRIDTVIDGQQRLSTISLLSTVLHSRIISLLSSIDESAQTVLESSIDDKYTYKLLDIFARELRRKSNKFSPVIIRGSEDYWVNEDIDGETYTSDLAKYLSACTRAYSTKSEFPKANILQKGLIRDNLTRMYSLVREIEEAHKSSEGEHAIAWELVELIPDREEWLDSKAIDFLKPLVSSLKQKIAVEKLTKSESSLLSIIQLLAFTHFLLQRCCFTIIEPADEEWAFDMFQSLNATGTPLTALETFKPLVVNMASRRDATGKEKRFKGSKLDDLFSEIDHLFKNQNSAHDKTKLTADFLTSFALIYNGEKLGSQFSEQRKWLNRVYLNGGDDNESKRLDFITHMSTLARYWTASLQLRKSYDVFELTKLSDSKRREAAFCQLYLIDSNHRMAHAVLGHFYHKVIIAKLEDETIVAHEQFFEAVKAVTAFYTLWRAAKSNSGLDNAYRRVFEKFISMQTLEKNGSTLTVQSLKEALRENLKYDDLEKWKQDSTRNLKYDAGSQKICRFVLMLVSNDTIEDGSVLGLMKRSSVGVSRYLDPELWNIDQLSTVEHIAPQEKPESSKWDEEIYINGSFDLIGNLTLLPAAINSSAGNHNWIIKWYYYKFLGSTDEQERDEVIQAARQDGLTLSPEILVKLAASSYAHHIRPISALGKVGKWNKGLIEQRTQRICDITWEVLIGWLS